LVRAPAGRNGGWSLDVVPGRVVHPGLLGGWELPSTSVQGGHGMKLHGTAALSWSDGRRQGWVEVDAEAAASTSLDPIRGRDRRLWPREARAPRFAS
jgi:hypothetical protein